jgi:hypothetical protein
LRSKVGTWFQGDEGKLVRFITTNGISLVPVVGQIAGFALGALDMFVLDDGLRENGPAVFLTKQYPSIFARPL